MHLKPNESFGYVSLQLVQRGHINDLFLDHVEERAQLYDGAPTFGGGYHARQQGAAES